MDVTQRTVTTEIEDLVISKLEFFIMYIIIFLM